MIDDREYVWGLKKDRPSFEISSTFMTVWVKWTKSTIGEIAMPG